MRVVLVGSMLLLVFSVTVRGADNPTIPAEEHEFFEKKIRPLLVKHCYSCHSQDAKKLRGDLRLDTREGIVKAAVIVPGDPTKSLLIQAVKHAPDVAEMPPDKKLSAAEIADLEAWVKMGAPDPRTGMKVETARLDPERAKEFWSFRPVQPVAIPEVRNPPYANPTAIDCFILAKLQKKNLTPAPLADKRTLIRRATYDLIGLPPTPEEIENFLKDDSPDAFAKVVDRLLASPHYGERWGRHWLDVIRYSDTAGDNSDYPIPQIFRYRNWVIEAFNRDMPYDEFVRKQLAGDLLPHKSEAERQANVIATGYIANSRRIGSYEEARYPWYLTYEDTIDNFGRAFLGLTIGCCRCHDHKFDPLSQADYYALYGFFSSTRYPRAGIELDKVQRDFVPLAPPEEVAKVERERKKKLDALNAAVKSLEAAEKKPAGLGTLAATGLSAKLRTVRKERDDLAKAPLPFEMAYAVVEGKTQGRHKVGNACIQIKGDPEREGPEVPRRFPTGLGGYELPANVEGSGRLQLAQWLTDAKNPLTARVMVNRIWHYHFGRGIVPTPSNFGVIGLPPSHPELLDYLAGQFVEKGWSVKAMHRMIMLSRTYQQSSQDDAANAKIDVGNEYFWRFNRRRLDAESIRDAMLSVSGNLDRTPSNEPHPFPDPKTWNFTQHNPFKAVYETNKRSVYVMTQRIQRHPFLALFDGADTNAGTDVRTTSTTPLQALYLMNDPFVHKQAKSLAKRLMAERSEDSARIERAYLLLMGRQPTAEEASIAREYLSQAAAKLGGSAAAQAGAWESLARALFLSNEFVYVE